VGQASSPPERGELAQAADIIDGARELGLALSGAQAALLARYCALLARWNRTHNLTAIDEPSQVLSHHLLDSLAIVPALAQIAGDQAVRILDLGSGGGLPGIPLAIACPQWHITLVDKVGKKVAFLNQARLELGLANIDTVHARVEQLAPGRTYDLIVARAFASLVELVASSRHLLSPRGSWAAMKGALPTTELAALAIAEPALAVTTVKLAVPRLAAERHLVLIRSSC
jgi:16S rRNA (guanine527-N7)-methyltransferase